ncbi:MBL fold metallo-hydrolase [Cellulomonas sp. NPDC055163]
MRLTWLGHSTVSLEADGVRVLVDPLLRRRAGALRTAPHAHDAVRGAGAEPAPEAVLLSHLHHDHCDLPTLRRLRAGVVLAPAGAGAWLTRRGVRHVEELPVGRTRAVAGLAVTSVPAEHGGRREPWGPTAVAVGHLVESSHTSVWLAGDTGLFAGMSAIPSLGVRGVVDVAVVPVWGWGPRLGPGHLDPAQAAAAARAVGARVAIPVHWGTLHVHGMSRVMGTRLTLPGAWFLRALGERRADPDRPGGGAASRVEGLVLRPGEPVDLA